MGSTVYPAAGGGVTQKTQEFTSTGTFTVPSNCTTIEILLVGGGGGGASTSNVSSVTYAGGGGGGQVVKKYLTVTAGSTYTVTIGAGGAGATANASNGSVGGNSSFGSLLVCGGGGYGGTRNTAGGAGAAGTNAQGGGYPGGTTYSFTSTWSAAPGGSGGGSGSDTSDVPGGTGGSASQMGYSFQQMTAAGLNYQTTPVGLYGFGAGGPAGLMRRDGAGLAAQANTGNGGGGAYAQGAILYSGGNGGSGYCLISYWS